MWQKIRPCVGVQMQTKEGHHLLLSQVKVVFVESINHSTQKRYFVKLRHNKFSVETSAWSVMFIKIQNIPLLIFFSDTTF